MREIKEILLWVFRPWLFFIGLYKDIKNWLILYKLTSQDNIEALLNKKGISVSWLGELYIIINVPDEFTQHEASIRMHVLSKLQEINGLMVELRIADIVYPYLTQFRGIASYRLILRTSREYLNIFSIGFRVLLIAILIYTYNKGYFNLIYDWIRLYIQ